MRFLLLTAIKITWRIFPENREACIFRKKCSRHIYQVTAEKGVIEGLKTFWFRYRNCRGGFSLLRHPLNGKMQMLLVTDHIINEEHIAERFLGGEEN